MLRQNISDQDPILSLKRTGQRYDKRFIRKIVQLIEEGHSRAFIHQTYNLHPATVSEWLRDYGSEHSSKYKRDEFILRHKNVRLSRLSNREE